MAFHFDDNIYAPAVIENLVYVSPEMLRDWRRQGLINNYGENVSGQWRYSPHDLVALWLANRLSNRGFLMSREESLRLGYSCAPNLARAIQQASAGILKTGNRYVATVYDGFGSGVGEPTRAHGMAMIEGMTLESFADKEYDRIEIIDLWRIADTVPDHIAVAVNLVVL